jgi:DNA repair photolyase
METIQRKTLLYKTGVGGMDYCINHVLGCAHGCRYPCYAFSMAQSYGRVRSYDEWCRPKLAANALQLLDKEIPKLKAKIRSVHLCFSTDPFMSGYPEVQEMSLAIISKLNAEGIPCSILTKGLLPAALAGSPPYSPDNDPGISLVSLDETFRKHWEPGAPPYDERIAALRYLHERGLHTWVHIEPFPTPNLIAQDIRPILEAVSFVDNISFEGWNYNPIIKKYAGYREFYLEQRAIAEEFCKKHNIAFSG